MVSWWEDVLAATDALIEPEFVVVPQAHPTSQMHAEPDVGVFGK